MRRLACCVLLVTTQAAADRVRVEPTGAPDAEALRGTVLVWHDAALLTEPSESAQTVRVGVLDAARTDRVGHVFPMRVLSVKGAFVEVEPAEPDCTWSRLAYSDDLSKLRLFVKRSDLAPVLTRPFTRTFADRTRLVLRPGVAVLPTTDGWAAVGLGGDELVAEIPAASIGYAYVPDRSPVVSVSPHEYAIDAKAPAVLGDQPVAVTRRATAVERHGDAAVITIDDRCSTVQLAIPSAAVREVADDESEVELGGSSGGVLDLRGEDYLPRQTALVAGTRQVAIAAKPIYVPFGVRGKSVCITRRLRLETSLRPAPASGSSKDIDDTLRLCAPATKVAHERQRSARSANGTTGR